MTLIAVKKTTKKKHLMLPASQMWRFADILLNDLNNLNA